MPRSRSGRATFSSTLSSGTRSLYWNTKPNRRSRSRLLTLSPSPPASTSPNRTSPASGFTIPAKHNSSEDVFDSGGAHHRDDLAHGERDRDVTQDLLPAEGKPKMLGAQDDLTRPGVSCSPQQ